MNFDKLIDGGYQICEVTLQGDVKYIIENIEDAFSAKLTRTTLLSSNDISGCLAIQHDDFWFHTDGCFLDIPPRWVALQILDSGEGGDIEILDVFEKIERVRKRCFIYGAKGFGVRRQVVDQVRGMSCLRYRSDYMQEIVPGSLEELDRCIANASGGASRLVGMTANAIVVIDNWRVMHRRTAFTGDRLVKRFWFDAI